MNKKLIGSIIILLVLVCLYFLNIQGQKNYTSTSSKLLNIEVKQIKKILIQSNDQALELLKLDTVWTISGHDTLNVKESSITQFFEKLVSLETQNMMTENKEKWGTYNIDDSTGTHLALVGWDNNTLDYFVFGNSSSDYAIMVKLISQLFSFGLYILFPIQLFVFQTKVDN